MLGMLVLSRICLQSFHKCTTRHFHQSFQRLELPRLQYSYAMGPSTDPLLGITVGQVIQRAANLFGDVEAVVFCHQNITKSFNEINEEAKSLASGFLAMGFQPGDRIGIWGPNSYEWYLTYFGAAKAGLVLVNINPSYKGFELEYSLKKVQAKGIICADKLKNTNYYDILKSIIPEVTFSTAGNLSSNNFPDLKIVISMSKEELPGTYKFKNVLSFGGSTDMKKVYNLDNVIQFDNPFNIQFTSGTTGLPKAALLSHHNLTNNAYFVGKRCGYDKKKARICLPVPLFHCFGGVVGALSNALFGGSTIFPSPLFDVKAVVKCLSEQRITSCFGVPTLFVDILNEFKQNPVDIKNLHMGIMTGAPCPEELVQAVMKDLHMKDFMIVYGLTETSPVSFQSFPEDSPSIRSKTIGKPSAHIEAKIVDPKGKIVPIGTPGELLVRGYSVFLGYWEDDQKTKETISSDRWLKTGDLVTMDKDGYASVVGRIKDMIIRGGENIYPAEIENLFMTHEDILEAQVFGVPDQRMGEEIAMWIKVGKNATVDTIALKEWARGKVAQFKIPRFILQMDEFPKNTSGKVLKNEMREQTIKLLKK